MATPLREYQEFDYQILESAPGKPLRVGGEMQLSDSRNLNRRIYPEALWQRVLEDSSRAMRRLKQRRMVGELDHPSSGKTTLRNASHVMTELRLQPSTRFPGKTAVYGVYECLPTPDGKILEALLRSKVGVQVSSRGDGDLEETAEGSRVIPESFELDTFDVVLDPSVDTDVRVLESEEAGKSKLSESCSCQLPEKSSKTIDQAILSVVESKDYDTTCAQYYKSLLLSSGAKSEAAQKALALIDESLEVTPIMKTNPGATAEDNASMRENQTVAQLNQTVAEHEKTIAASNQAVESLLVQCRNYKMRADYYEAEVTRLRGIAERYEDAKAVISKCRESILQLQNSHKLKEAATRLLGSLLAHIDTAKRTAYVDRMLARESQETRSRLRPVLLKCESRSEVNKTLISLRPLQENRRQRNLPPVTESNRASRSIPAFSPLMESKAAVHDGRIQQKPGKIDESVELAKRLINRDKQG